MDPPSFDWRRWLAIHGEEIPLDESLYQIAVDEGATVPFQSIQQQLDELAYGLSLDPFDPTDSVERLAERLCGEGRFCGDEQDYEHPQNSRIDRVLARRKGLPILLCVVAIEVARRSGLSLVGVGFPGHFLTSTTREPRIFFDPFYGRLLDAHLLAARLASEAPIAESEIERALAPIHTRDLLIRVSTNLMGSWLRRGEFTRALRNADRRVALRPEHPEWLRDRGWLQARLGRSDRAAIDLADYLDARPDAADATRVRQLLSSLPLASS